VQKWKEVDLLGQYTRDLGVKPRWKIKIEIILIIFMVSDNICKKKLFKCLHSQFQCYEIA